VPELQEVQECANAISELAFQVTFLLAAAVHKSAFLARNSRFQVSTARWRLLNSLYSLYSSFFAFFALFCGY